MSGPGQQRSAEPGLVVSDLHCSRDGRDLFKGLSFLLRAGELLVVEGRNGSGKTSLLRILCGIRMQESGSINWGGSPIGELGPLYHQEMTYIGHHDGIKGDLTVAENIQLAKALGKPSGDDLQTILKRLQLSGYNEVLAKALSAGQKRRLALSRLLATVSWLWILDEPFTSLDRLGIEICEHLISSHLTHGGMVVMTSHHAMELPGVEITRLRLS
ncbi:MAG: cytochrome c biogenesis heme-transporting ATPase CcmA [Pseudomonadota bacterium]|nr:cytochrome c biogenesis heme-transporting ATPase CcmA [Pseudomonadota bacterium]